MATTLKTTTIEYHRFDGENFDELKDFCPQLEKYDFRGFMTVGFPTHDPFASDSFAEALPGFYVVKEDGQFTIYTQDDFNRKFS